MAKFGYLNRREMEPRPGRNYATIYYRQSASERRRTQRHIEQTIQDLADRAGETPDGLEALTDPLPGFRRRESQGNYSAVDVMSDLLTQMQSGRDIASGLVGRWNRLFAGTGREIDLVPEQDLPVALPAVFDLMGPSRS